MKTSSAGVWIGGVLVALLLAAFLPLFTCPTCEGRGEFSVRGLGQVQIGAACPRCDGRKRVSGFNRLFRRSPPGYAS